MYPLDGCCAFLFAVISRKLHGLFFYRRVITWHLMSPLRNSTITTPRKLQVIFCQVPLRRAYLNTSEGLNCDFVTLAVWSQTSDLDSLTHSFFPKIIGLRKIIHWVGHLLYSQTWFSLQHHIWFSMPHGEWSLTISQVWLKSQKRKNKDWSLGLCVI